MKMVNALRLAIPTRIWTTESWEAFHPIATSKSYVFVISGTSLANFSDCYFREYFTCRFDRHLIRDQSPNAPCQVHLQFMFSRTYPADCPVHRRIPVSPL
jgi:hypothetical protein